MGEGPAVSLKGYREFARALRSAELGDALKDAHKQIATAVVERASKIGVGLGGVQAHVVHVKSIRATREASKSSIRMGGAAKKHGPAFGAEFGSKQFPQFPPWLGNGENAGYMVHPAIRKMVSSGEVMDLWESAVAKVLNPAFPD